LPHIKKIIRTTLTDRGPEPAWPWTCFVLHVAMDMGIGLNTCCAWA